MVREIQRINPAGLNDPSNYGYSHVTVVPSGERNAMWNSNRKPASTLIPVPRLAVDGMLFEIDAVAVIPNS